MIENKTLETWAVVEVMGHKRFAGFVTEQAIAGAAFVRVDVPKVQIDAGGETLPAFTKLLGVGSIYAITPCTMETAYAFAAKIQERAFANYEAPRLPAKLLSTNSVTSDAGADYLADGFDNAEYDDDEPERGVSR